MEYCIDLIHLSKVHINHTDVCKVVLKHMGKNTAVNLNNWAVLLFSIPLTKVWIWKWIFI